ncbi:MAG: SMP-30/gluconolactonase/LRE family protein [Verrucomicrobiia bacterium]
MAAEKVRGDFQFLEGPVWVPAREELIFSDIPASRIYRYTPATNSFSVFREPSGQANGNALDPQGRLVTCEHENRRTSRTEPDGAVVPLATHYEGKRLNSPNDIVCRSDGSVYFSDPPYGVKAELRELDFQGVYRIEPTPYSSKEGSSVPVPLPGRGQGWVPPIQLLVRDFIKPNGLAFSPDEKILYIADTELGHIRGFDVNADGTITNSRVFCKVERPDGFRVDIEGNLYISAMVSVEIFDRTGKKIGEITLDQRPANVAFGDPDRKTLYICARTGFYKARVSIPGVAMP